MPRQPSVPFAEIRSALLSLNDYFNSNGRLHPPSHDIWRQVSEKLDNKVKSAYIWQIMWEGRYNILAEIQSNVGQECDRIENGSPTILNISTSLSDSQSLEESEDDRNVVIKPQANFILNVPAETWKVIEPIEVVHKRGKDRGTRTVVQLAAGWTTIISEMLWNQHKIPCPYIYKKSRVAREEEPANHYISIKAFCKECKGEATGKIIDRPTKGEGVQIYWRAIDTRGIPHSKKRPVTGKERDKMGEELKHTSASLYRKSFSSRTMDYDDPEPPTLPKQETLRKIKQEVRDIEVGTPIVKDPIASLIGMKYMNPFAGVIHDICADKFMVSYHSPAQRRFYREYRRHNYTILALDATGSLVRKLKRPGTLSGHIFLYEAVLNGKEFQLPMFQMLSEKHDSNTISYWLSEWERNGVPVPHQVVCDQSKALLSALARSFGKCSTFKEYKERCFSALVDKTPLPPCYIRIDIAHFMSSASKWGLWAKTSNARVKEFYLRCLGLLIKSKSIVTFRSILLNILCCAIAETNGKIVGSDQPSPSEASCNALLNLIETFDEDILSHVKVDNVDYDYYNITDEINDSDESERTQKWISETLQCAKNRCDIEGDRLSPYHSPEVAKKMCEIASDFCTWSGVLLDLYGAPNVTASSASVEGDFNDLKHRILGGDVGPLAVNKFVAKHIQALDGSIKLASAAVKQSEDWKNKNPLASLTVQTVVSKHIRASDSSINLASATANQCEEKGNMDASEELMLSEDWRGLAQPKKKKRVSKYTHACPQIKAVQEANKMKPPQASLQLLRNGNLTGFISLGKVDIEVHNTCSFDAVCQVISLMYIEDECFRDSVKRETNQTTETAKCLALHGATISTYKCRIDALSNVLEGKEFPKPSKNKKMIRYNCWGNVTHLVKTLFHDCPSATVRLYCNSPECDKQLKMKITKITVLDTNAKIILTEGLTSLQQAVMRCLPTIGETCCTKAEVAIHLGECVFVDMDYLGASNIGSVFGAAEQHNRKYRLEEIPKKIEIANVNLTLRGIVAYLPNHYVGFGLHITGHWDMYDDMQKCIVKNIDDQHSILPHLLIYSKQSYQCDPVIADC